MNHLKTTVTRSILALVVATSALAAADFQWKREAESAALLKGDKVVWQFNYTTNKATKPFFHPVALPGGSSLTCQSPPDHAWHYALWFSWKYINKVNYWEQNKDGASAGTTKWSQVKVVTNPDFSARIELALRYYPATNPQPALVETRNINISAPATDGSYFMDWDMKFTAGSEDLLFDRTPPVPKSWGGYAGLSARFSKDLKDVKLAATGDMGDLKNSRFGFSATAADFNGRLDEKEQGLAMLDHPQNPRAPSRWYVIQEPKIPFWFMNAAFLQMEPFKVAAKEKFELRYRVLVHPDRWDAGRLQK
jgi:hypothetical protein